VKLSALALDYDGTISVNGVMDPSVREAIGDARRRGIVVLLVTGRRLGDLRRVCADLSCFDVIVAENGAVLDFPESGRHVLLGHPPSRAFMRELALRGVPFDAGESVVEMDARFAAPTLDVIRTLEQPLILAFNRGRLMVLPQSVGKSTGLRQALASLRLSIHNTLGIGDAENDHDLLDACEVGVAVEWGSPALRGVADEVIAGSGPPAVADYIRRIVEQPRLAARQMGRRRLVLGHQNDGREVSLAVRGRTMLIAGEPGTGKSWLAGLVCEQSILQGYCLCIIDPEGDYRSLEALPGVVVLGGDDPPPRARELERALRHADITVVIDLSRLSHRAKRDYVGSLMPVLNSLRRATGLPHKIVLDEAHYFLADCDVAHVLDMELAGYVLVTYRVSALPDVVRGTLDNVVMVTRESDPAEIRTLLSLCRPRLAESSDVFASLLTAEAALLPGPEEAHGRACRFRMAPRLTAHVRHRTKYLDMPVVETQSFVFDEDGQPGVRARTLKEFTGLLSVLPAERLVGHLRRHDFSRWLAEVFRDHPLAARLRTLEDGLNGDSPRDVAEAIAHAIRARYETGTDAGRGADPQDPGATATRVDQ